MAAALALHPKLLPRPAPKMRLARGDGRFQRRLVHPRHHQHPPSGLLLHDGRNQSIRVKLQFLVKTHAKVIFPQNRPETILKIGNPAFKARLGTVPGARPSGRINVRMPLAKSTLAITRMLMRPSGRAPAWSVDRTPAYFWGSTANATAAMMHTNAARWFHCGRISR